MSNFKTKSLSPWFLGEKLKLAADAPFEPKQEIEDAVFESCLLQSGPSRIRFVVLLTALEIMGAGMMKHHDRHAVLVLDS